MCQEKSRRIERSRSMEAFLFSYQVHCLRSEIGTVIWSLLIHLQLWITVFFRFLLMLPYSICSHLIQSMSFPHSPPSHSMKLSLFMPFLLISLNGTIKFHKRYYLYVVLGYIARQIRAIIICVGETGATAYYPSIVLYHFLAHIFFSVFIAKENNI